MLMRPINIIVKCKISMRMGSWRSKMSLLEITNKNITTIKLTKSMNFYMAQYT